jgi:hypothetical protein
LLPAVNASDATGVDRIYQTVAPAPHRLRRQQCRSLPLARFVGGALIAAADDHARNCARPKQNVFFTEGLFFLALFFNCPIIKTERFVRRQLFFLAFFFREF